MLLPRDKDGQIPEGVVIATTEALAKHARLSVDEARQLLRKIEQAAENWYVLNDPKPFLAAKAY